MIRLNVLHNRIRTWGAGVKKCRKWQNRRYGDRTLWSGHSTGAEVACCCARGPRWRPIAHLFRLELQLLREGLPVVVAQMVVQHHSLNFYARTSRTDKEVCQRRLHFRLASLEVVASHVLHAGRSAAKPGTREFWDKKLIYEPGAP